MASCDDDFPPLLGDADEARQAAASLAAAAAAAIASEKAAANSARRDKRKDRAHHDDLVVGASDGEAPSSSPSPSPSPYSIASRSAKKQLLQLHEEKNKERERERGEYRKDREEWSDGAIEALLDAYTQRFELLNRGNLRGRDWEDVAAAVSQGGGDRDGKGKTVEQCKNKIDNLKKRYKVELHRLSTGGLSVSHWPWFAKLDVIVSASSNSNAAVRSQSQNQSPSAIPPISAHLPDDDRSPSASGSASAAPVRQSKRYAAALAQGSMRAFPASIPKCKWKRVLLKVSGSALAGSGTAPHNVDPKVTL